MARGPPVAAFTKMSNGALAANRARSASRSCTSQTCNSTPARTLCWARYGRRLAATTDTPSLANWLVAAKPIPELPPRTMARFPCSIIDLFLCREFLLADASQYRPCTRSLSPTASAPPGPVVRHVADISTERRQMHPPIQRHDPFAWGQDLDGIEVELLQFGNALHQGRNTQ